MTQSDLAGKVAVVTGGARGLGATTAAELANRGAKVIVADLDDIDPAECTLPMDKIHRTIRLDVRDPQSWAELVDSVRSNEGRLDILHLNAGITGTPRISGRDDGSFCHSFQPKT